MTAAKPFEKRPPDRGPSLDRGRYRKVLLDSFDTVIGFDACLLLRAGEDTLTVEAARGEGLPEVGCQFAASVLDQTVPPSRTPPWPEASFPSWLFVSIEAGGKRVEAVALGRRQNAFSERERLEAEAIARLAGHVFGGDSMQAEMAEQLTRFSILIKIGQALSSSLDLDLLLEKVYQEVSRFFDTTNFYIALSRPESQEFVMGIAIEHGQREIDHATYPIGNGLTGHVLRTAKSLFLPAYAEQQDFLKKEGVVAIGELPRSWMGVPLIAGDMVVGVMAIQDYEREGAYAPADLELFSAIASQIAVTVRNAQLYEDAERRARETSVLAAIGRDISSTLDLETVLGRIVACVRELLTMESVAIFLTREDRLSLSPVVVSGNLESQLQGMLVERGKGILGAIVDNAKAELVNDVSLDPRAFHIPGTEEEERGEKFMAAPFFSQEQVIGAVAVWRGPREPAFKPDDLVFLEGIGQQASIAIRNAQLYSQTKKLATTDGLTGLLNRRCLTEKIDVEYAKTRRYKRPTSLVMVDVDFFKRVNDTHGHDIGDTVLRAIAGIIAESVRNCDSVGRYGGEEFVILLPETGLEGAYTLSERIREAIEGREIPLVDGGVLSVTASFGVAGVGLDDPNYEVVLKRADKALYHAKGHGRNRVSCGVDESSC